MRQSYICIFQQKYVHSKASLIAILTIDNRDGDTRIRLLYYNLSNDYFIRSCRHGAILISVFVIKSFTGKSRIEYARKFNRENTDESAPIDSGGGRRKSSFNIKLHTHTHIASPPVSSFICQYLPLSLVPPPLSPLLPFSYLRLIMSYEKPKSRVTLHAIEVKC